MSHNTSYPGTQALRHSLTSFLAVAAISASFTVGATPPKNTDSETQQLFNTLISDQEAIRAGQDAVRHAQAFVNSIVTDASGQLVSFRRNGKTITPLFDNGKLQGYDDGVERVFFSGLSVDGSNDPVALAIKTTNGKVEQVIRLAHLRTVSPQASNFISSSLVTEDRPLAAVEQEARINKAAADGTNPISAYRPERPKAQDEKLRICGIGCDMDRDIGVADCDRDFDIEMLGLGAGAGVAAASLSPPVILTYAAVGFVAGVVAFRLRYQCKDRTARKWAECQINCS
jgi:hypothetical protein